MSHFATDPKESLHIRVPSPDQLDAIRTQAEAVRPLSLNLQGNQLTALPDWLGNLTSLTTLNLSSNRLKVLPDSLGNLTSLTTLNLSSNELKVLPDSLGNLTSLTTLNLSSNELKVLPDSLGNLTSLTTLDLSSNELKVLPDWLGNLTSLTTLDLGFNGLKVLPDSLGNLTSLTTLDLGFNGLKVLPDSLGNLTSLTTLDLGLNELKVLPDSLGNLTSLTTLNLQGNQLTALPDSLGNLTSLTTLNLQGNQLTALPDWLGNLTSLTTLDLGLNGLKVLPDWLGNLTSLTTLDLGLNGLKVLPDWLGNLTSLTTLDLGFIGLKVLPDWLGNLTSLTTLNLQRNQLTALPDSLGNLTSLTTLDLGLNGLKVLPDWLGNLTSLTTLDLGFIGLKVLPDWLGNLTSLTTLNLQRNQLTALPDSLGNLTSLTTLDLSSNELKVLPDSLGNLTSLTTLNLGLDGLKVLPDWLGNLTSLTTLDLSSNELKVLPDWLGNLTSLTTLNLRLDGLKVLPDSLGNLTSLTTLNLSSNELKVLPDSLGNLTSLTTLHLSSNELKVLPDWLGNLTSLTTLDLGLDGLKVLPDWLGNLTSLTTLDLGLNRLKVLPDWLGNLISLTTLNLQGNQLTALPDSLGNLTSLTTLHLSSNRLKVLPDSLGNLTSLTTLNVSSNELKVLPDSLGNLTSLTTLDLSSNRLKVLPDSLGNLTSLTTLDLSSNRLKVLPDSLGNLTSLTTLDLGFNGLKVLPDWLGNLTSLTTLDLGFIGLKVLPDWLGNLTSLTTLDLGFNGLKVLPDWLGNLTSLTTLHLSSNELSSLPPCLLSAARGISAAELGPFGQRAMSLRGNPLPPEVLAADAGGDEELLSFLNSLSEQARSVSEAKLVLVGEGAVGKSSLLAALRAEAWQDNRSQTHGLEIKELVLDHGGRSVTLHAWDFGGQKHYRPTHQLFFTEPAVYVVVWKPREGPELGMVEEWLETVRNRTGSSARVLVVASHGGPQSAAAAIDQGRLRDRFGDMILGFYDVDSILADDRLGRLRAAIAHAADGLPHTHRQYPGSWLAVQEDIARRPEQSLTYDQYQRIAAERGLSAVAAKSLARNAHALGVWVHYDDDESLQDLLVTKPDWLSEAIARVLDAEAVDNSAGLVAHATFSQLWSHPGRGFTHTQKQQFLRLMERFELTYRVPESTFGGPTSLVAQLVPGDRPNLAEFWDDFRGAESEVEELCRVYELGSGVPGVVPESLMYRLIVRLHDRRLKDSPGGVHWRHGMIVSSHWGARALVTASRDSVRVQVRGPDRATFLHQIADDVVDVVAFWKGLEVRQSVTCGRPCAFGGPGGGQFDRQKLINKLEKSSGATMGCPRPDCDQEPAASELLHAVPATGLDRKVDAILAATVALRSDLSQATSEQRAQLATIEVLLTQVMHGLDDDGHNGPRLFTWVPLGPTLSHPNVRYVRVRLTLFCEHSRLPVHVLDDNPPAGVYEFDLPREWWTKYAPKIRYLMQLLQPLVGVAAAGVALATPAAEWESIEGQVQAARETVGLAIEATTPALAQNPDTPDTDPTMALGQPTRAEGTTLQMLHKILRDKDPGYADLRRVRGSRGGYLWVHRRYATIYDPGLPEIPNA